MKNRITIRKFGTAALSLLFIAAMFGCAVPGTDGGYGAFSLSLPAADNARAVFEGLQYTKAVVHLMQGGSYLSLNPANLYQPVARSAARHEVTAASLTLDNMPAASYALLLGLVNGEGEIVAFDRIPFTIRAGQTTTVSQGLYRGRVTITDGATAGVSFNAGMTIGEHSFLVDSAGRVWIDGALAVQPVFSNAAAKVVDVMEGARWNGTAWVSQPWLLVNNYGVLPISSVSPVAYDTAFSAGLDAADVTNITEGIAGIVDIVAVNNYIEETADQIEGLNPVAIVLVQGPGTLAAAALTSDAPAPTEWFGLSTILGESDEFSDLLEQFGTIIRGSIIGDDYFALSTPIGDYFMSYADIGSGISEFMTLFEGTSETAPAEGESEEVDIELILEMLGGSQLFGANSGLVGRQVGQMAVAATATAERLYVSVKPSGSGSTALPGGIYSAPITQNTAGSSVLGAWSLVPGTSGLAVESFAVSPDGRVAAVVLTRDAVAAASVVDSVIVFTQAGISRKIPFYAGIPGVLKDLFWSDAGDTLNLLATNAAGTGGGVRELRLD